MKLHQHSLDAWMAISAIKLLFVLLLTFVTGSMMISLKKNNPLPSFKYTEIPSTRTDLFQSLLQLTDLPEAILSYLEKHPKLDLNMVDENDDTLLMLAAKMGLYHMAAALILAGADRDVRKPERFLMNPTRFDIFMRPDSNFKAADLAKSCGHKHLGWFIENFHGIYRVYQLLKLIQLENSDEGRSHLPAELVNNIAELIIWTHKDEEAF